MPDLRDVLSSEAERLRPDRVPAFGTVLGRRRRRDRRARGLAVLGVAALVAAALVVVPALVSSDDGALQPADPPPVSIPDVLVVECGDTGPTLPNGSQVAAQRDGVHFLFNNPTGVDAKVWFGQGGEVVPAGSKKRVTSSEVAPGQPSIVNCLAGGSFERTQQLPVTVVDPTGVYVDLPVCEGKLSYPELPESPRTGDPVSLTRADHWRAEPVGYPAGNPRLVFTGDSLIRWQGREGSWAVTYRRPCTAEPPHPVAAGIKAPPPQNSAETDEFGVITAIRDNGRTEIEVDRVDMLGGAEAEAAAAADGTDVSNDYYLRNDNPATRTYQLSPSVRIWGDISFGHEPGGVRIDLDELRTFLSSSELAKTTLFHLDVEDGLVVGIEEQYRP
jgi:hypothetical protein